MYFIIYLLRKIIKIKFPYKIKNEHLYKITNENIWTNIIKQRRFRWIGHLLRLSENAPAKLALKELNNFNSTNKRCNKTTWKKIINNDLREIKLGYSIANADVALLARDRERWWKTITCKASVALNQSVYD